MRFRLLTIDNGIKTTKFLIKFTKHGYKLRVRFNHAGKIIDLPKELIICEVFCFFEPDDTCSIHGILFSVVVKTKTSRFSRHTVPVNGFYPHRTLKL